jgi:hypothetical protein
VVESLHILTPAEYPATMLDRLAAAAEPGLEVFFIGLGQQSRFR